MTATEVSHDGFRELVDTVTYQARCVGLRSLDAVQFVDQRRPRLFWKRREGQAPVVYVPRAGRTRAEVIDDLVAQTVATQDQMCTFHKAAAVRTILIHFDDYRP